MSLKYVATTAVIALLVVLGYQHYETQKKAWAVHRRLAFWVAVGGVSILSNLGLEIAANRFHSPGLKRFAALTHLGAAGGQNA